MRAFLLILAVLAGSLLWLTPSPARCLYCSTVPCWSSSFCGSPGCVCLGGSAGIPGRCVAVRLEP